jgi:hypothetical protein
MSPWKSIICTDDEYAFLEDFTDAVSEREGHRLRMSQALVKAAMQYRVKDGLAE